MNLANKSIHLCKIFMTRLYCSTNLSPVFVCGMPKPIKLSNGNLADHVHLAVEHLKAGHLIALPTDTLYGLAGLAQHSKAVTEVYRVKQRNEAKPLAVCVGQVNDFDKWAEITVSQDLLEDLLPGPVTLIFKRKPALNSDLNPDTELIGIRIPDSEFICEVAKKCGAPLALTSANISNQQSPLTVEEFHSIWSDCACVFDGGRIGAPVAKKNSSEVVHLKKAIKLNLSDIQDIPNFITNSVPSYYQESSVNVREGSTIVNLSEEGFYKVLRQGIALHNTLNILHKYGLRPAPSD